MNIARNQSINLTISDSLKISCNLKKMIIIIKIPTSNTLRLKECGAPPITKSEIQKILSLPARSHIIIILYYLYPPLPFSRKSPLDLPAAKALRRFSTIDSRGVPLDRGAAGRNLPRLQDRVDTREIRAIEMRSRFFGDFRLLTLGKPS